MKQPPLESSTDADIDEAAAESFPASDAPVWSSAHAGTPALPPLVLEHGHEVVRGALRADLDRLAHVTHNGKPMRVAREDLFARALLDGGRAILREPIDDQLTVRTVEVEQVGTEREASCVVLGARYDEEDVSGAAMLLALVRSLAPARLVRTVRFVGFADVPSRASPSKMVSGSARYADRLLASGASVHAMLALGRLDFARERKAAIVFASGLRSRSMLKAAIEAFRKTSRVEGRAIPLPSWSPGIRSSDHMSFGDRGWPAMVAADASPWRVRSPAAPDVDRMAAALPGLVAVVARLAGGRD